MRRLGLMLVAGLLVALAALPVGAASTTWKLYSFNPSGRALRSEVAKFADGSVSVKLPTDSYVGAAYLTSSKIQSTGALSATVSISADLGTTISNYPGCSNNPNLATVGLYFDANGKGGFNPSDYWWSSQRVPLNSIVGSSAALTTALSQPLLWTNYYGKPGDQPGTYVVGGVTYPSAADGFAYAVAHMSSWGVSFGGDCFYANGVAASNSSATFTLMP